MSSDGSAAAAPEPAPAPWLPPATITELYHKMDGGKFAGLNRPTAGARDETPVPDGPADIQLYSLGTPNGQKVTLLLEELGVECASREQKPLTGRWVGQQMRCSPRERARQTRVPAVELP
jgi:hypothetical protein